MSADRSAGIALTLGEAAEALGGELTPADAAGRSFFGVSIDSRTVRSGQAFFAIGGERFDGHRFAADAARAGAAAVIVEREVPELDGVERPARTAVLRVADTVAALGALARAWRRRVAPLAIGITGSLGKTTTKQLTAQILALAGPTHATPGNFNNEIGLPLTLLAMPPSTRFLVAEMGMNAPGEIARLAAIAEPEIGAITAIAAVHLEGLGSIEAIAAAKAELLHALPTAGTAVVPDEPLLAPHLAKLRAGRVVRFGSAASCDVRLSSVTPRGEAGSRIELELGGDTVAAELQLPGSYHGDNAAAAAAIALAAGIDGGTIARGLSRPVAGLGHRSRLLDVGRWRVLDDCYNASPRATIAALGALRELAGARPAVAVLGEMRELGAGAEALHREVGAACAGLELRALVAVGEPARAYLDGAREAGIDAERLVWVSDAEQAAARVAAALPAAGWVLVKGSRGARMERVIEALESFAEPAD